MSFRRLFLSLALCGSLFTHTAQASLVTNGGFETGNFDGWSLLNYTSDSDRGANLRVGGQLSGLTPHSGSQQAAFSSHGGASGIAQTLDTVVGQTYILSFWLATPADCNTLCWADVSIGGESVLLTNDLDASEYTQFTHEMVATSTSTLLQFYLKPPSLYYSFVLLDDVSLVALNTPADVPEPATLALAGMALLGAGAATRRRRAAA